MYKYLLIFFSLLLLGQTQEDASKEPFDPVKEIARIQFERFLAPFDAWIEVKGPEAQMSSNKGQGGGLEFRKETIWYCMVLFITESEDYRIYSRFGLNANERKTIKEKYGETEMGGYEYERIESMEEYCLRVRNEVMKDLMNQTMKDVKNPDCQDLLKNGKGVLYYLPSEQTDPKNIQKNWKIY